MNAEDASLDFQKIATANCLDQSGKTPFHLKIAFQVYNLEGKPSDTGTVEEWWVDHSRSRVAITLSSFKSTDAILFDDATNLEPRKRYLIQKLLQTAVHPGPLLPMAATTTIQEDSKDFDKLRLNCLTTTPNDAFGGRQPATFCVDPHTNALRVQTELGVESTVRNGIGTFHATSVSLDLQISFEKRLAITGKVTTLQVYDSSRSAVQFSDTTITAPSTERENANLVAGKILSKSAPIYPSHAKLSHVSGTVVLHAVISKQGTVKDIFTIASPDPSLTQSAIDSVKQWTYQPYLLNGQPTEVETFINMNFLFHGTE